MAVTTSEGKYLQVGDQLDYTPTAALGAGEVIQLEDGRAGVAVDAIAAARKGAVHTRGVFNLPKTASVVMLKGGRAFWDQSANKVHFKRTAGTRDFYIGVVAEDATAAATTVKVALNVSQQNEISLLKGEWLEVETLGLGVVPIIGNGAKLAFDAVAEAATAALYSLDTVDVDSNPILEFEAAIYGIGDDAALDISLGLANDTHATDFDAVTEACILHLDGNALDILAESDDGTTEVAATDTTVDAVDDTYFECWIDCRNLADIQIYIDGVLMLTATVFKLDAATGPIRPIFHIEKTSNDTVADVRIRRADLRTMNE